jgi:CRP-like cAMP-binding protein
VATSVADATDLEFDGMWEGDTSAVRGPLWTDLSAMAGLDEGVLRATCRRRRFARGEIVFHEGDPAGSFHLIDSGRVAIRLTTPRGDVATVDILQAGDSFGEQALIDDTPVRSATVTALEPVETLSLDAATFDQLRADHPRIDRFLLMVVSARLRSTTHQLLEALYVPADVRVMRCLLRLHSMFVTGQSGDADGSIPVTQDQIATMTGMTRSTVNRLVRQAQLDGLLAVTRSRVEILDEPGVRRRALMAAPR